MDLAILSALMKNSKISDRKLAKMLGVSQPTITRRRTRLEKDGLLDYRIVPNFGKLGYEILAFTLLVWKREEHMKLTQEEDYWKKVEAFLSDYPNIVFASSGHGLGMTRIVVSVHESYSDYVKLMTKIDEGWGMYMNKFDSFIVSLKSDNILRQFSFEHLIDTH